MAAFPSLDLTDLDLSEMEAARLVGRAAGRATRLARDLGFVAVGLGVMAVMEARRRTDRG